MTTSNKQTKAFTMLELVFVIVVLGILAALALPRMDRDLRQEAADNVLSAIRYTQHLAMVDDVTNPFVNNWQKALWQIRFTKNGAGDTWSYTVGSNSNYQSNINKNSEAAIDPANGKYLYNQSPTSPQPDESPNIFLTKKYGIKSTIFNNCSGTYDGTNSSHIAFDNLGRLHRGVSTGGSNNYQTYVKNTDCNITFSFTGGSPRPFSIIIKKETGYAYIDEQDDS